MNHHGSLTEAVVVLLSITTFNSRHLLLVQPRRIFLDWIVKHQLMQTYEPGDGEFYTRYLLNRHAANFVRVCTPT